MTLIFTFNIDDGHSGTSVGFTEENCPELTEGQLVKALKTVIKQFFTKEMARQGKHATMMATEPGKNMHTACVFMSASQRLAEED